MKRGNTEQNVLPLEAQKDEKITTKEIGENQDGDEVDSTPNIGDDQDESWKGSVVVIASQ